MSYQPSYLHLSAQKTDECKLHTQHVQAHHAPYEPAPGKFVMPDPLPEYQASDRRRRDDLKYRWDRSCKCSSIYEDDVRAEIDDLISKKNWIGYIRFVHRLEVAKRFSIGSDIENGSDRSEILETFVGNLNKWHEGSSGKGTYISLTKKTPVEYWEPIYQACLLKNRGGQIDFVTVCREVRGFSDALITIYRNIGLTYFVKAADRTNSWEKRTTKMLYKEQFYDLSDFLKLRLNSGNASDEELRWIIRAVTYDFFSVPLNQVEKSRIEDYGLDVDWLKLDKSPLTQSETTSTVARISKQFYDRYWDYVPKHRETMRLVNSDNRHVDITRKEGEDCVYGFQDSGVKSCTGKTVNMPIVGVRVRTFLRLFIRSLLVKRQDRELENVQSVLCAMMTREFVAWFPKLDHSFLVSSTIANDLAENPLAEFSSANLQYLFNSATPGKFPTAQDFINAIGETGVSLLGVDNQVADMVMESCFSLFNEDGCQNDVVPHMVAVIKMFDSNGRYFMEFVKEVFSGKTVKLNLCGTIGAMMFPYIAAGVMNAKLCSDIVECFRECVYLSRLSCFVKGLKNVMLLFVRCVNGGKDYNDNIELKTLVYSLLGSIPEISSEVKFLVSDIDERWHSLLTKVIEAKDSSRKAWTEFLTVEGEVREDDARIVTVLHGHNKVTVKIPGRWSNRTGDWVFTPSSTVERLYPIVKKTVPLDKFVAPEDMNLSDAQTREIASLVEKYRIGNVETTVVETTVVETSVAKPVTIVCCSMSRCITRRYNDKYGTAPTGGYRYRPKVPPPVEQPKVPPPVDQPAPQSKGPRATSGRGKGVNGVNQRKNEDSRREEKKVKSMKLTFEKLQARFGELRQRFYDIRDVKRKGTYDKFCSQKDGGRSTLNDVVRNLECLVARARDSIYSGNGIIKNQDFEQFPTFLDEFRTLVANIEKSVEGLNAFVNDYNDWVLVNEESPDLVSGLI
jgi:hypothetical protein